MALFFENHLIYEIYANEDISICNVANQSYVLFSYKFFTEHMPYGVVVSADQVMTLVKNKMAYLYYFTLDGTEFKSRSIKFCKDNYPVVERFKQKNDQRGPSESIDPEMERIVRAKYMGK